MSAEELERQLMLDAGMKMSTNGDQEHRVPSPAREKHSPRVETASSIASPKEIRSSEAGISQTPTHMAPTDAAALPNFPPPPSGFPHPIELQAFLQKNFPAQDQILQINSTNPLDLYQRRLTFLHIIQSQVMITGMPAGFPPCVPPPMGHSTPANGITGPIPSMQQHGSNEPSSPALQKLFSQSGSRNESHASSPVPTVSVS